MITTATASAVLTALLDHASAIGVFEVVRIGEYTSPPPSGLVFALWPETLGATQGGGLATTNALVSVSARIYYPAFAKPETDRELKVLGAADAYLGRLNGAFTLGDTVRNVDLLGATGEEMTWTFGWLNIDSKWSRIADLGIRAVINDAWMQGA